MIKAIGECIGPIIKIDYHKENGRRGRFARMAISLDLQKPLISKLLVNSRIQIVEHESLPTICFVCGKYGHVKDICPLTMELATAVTDPTACPISPLTPIPDEPFRPRMKVECRQRRSVLKGPSSKASNHDISIKISRFNPILRKIL
ncbi:hypothetical protein V6N11_054155 [Hibiscus sabdariffa]|uniref:CCHC-type domain-containing protein n=1 Tax=Hibiscus sabdariffa TaxID=183260 RepID=A0ABR2S3I8_9ROSI